MKIVAYGSLMNQSSLERTLGRPAVLKPIKIPGYSRVFDAPFDGYAFLNITPSGGVMEAAFFTLSTSELELFAKREAGSELVACVPGYYAFMWNSDRRGDLPALQSYIDVCESGAQVLNIDMWKGTVTPQTIINDQLNPQYEK